MLPYLIYLFVKYEKLQWRLGENFNKYLNCHNSWLTMTFLKSHVAQSRTNDCMSVYADFLWGSKIVWHKFWSCTYCRWFRKSLLRSGSAVEAEKFCVEKMEKRRKCHQAYNTKTCWRSCRMSGDLNDINHAHKYLTDQMETSYSNAFMYTSSLRSVNFSVNRSRVLSDVCLLWATLM